MHEQKNIRKIPSVEDVLREQDRLAEKDRAVTQAKLPAVVRPTPVLPALTEAEGAAARAQLFGGQFAEIGRRMKFDFKAEQFVYDDTGEAADLKKRYLLLVTETVAGYIRFFRDGEAEPERHMGPIYKGYRPPHRDELGCMDTTEWQPGLDGQPEDPYKFQYVIALQEEDSGALFTLSAMSRSAIRAVASLLRTYDTTMARYPGCLPIIRLAVGKKDHKDTRIGEYAVPLFIIESRWVPPETAKPFNDSLAGV